MLSLNKQKIVISFVICIFLSAVRVFACTCVSLPDENINDAVKSAYDSSTMVFAGKVVGFEYRKGIPNRYMGSREKDTGKHVDYETLVVKFQVDKWWKGEALAELFLATLETKNADGTASRSSCDYRFKEGESYLVYADGKANELRTYACSRTRFLSQTKDLEILGQGNPPVEK